MNYLITGGTGSLGSALVRHLLLDPHAERIIIFSRDEAKQAALAASCDDAGGKLRFFLGDIRDVGRLYEALWGVDIVIHTAALKRVDQVSYNPSEVVLTNVAGTLNVLRASREADVTHVLMISSDKAVHPANVYGASKLLGEFLTIRSNVMSYPQGMMASVLRYGNVWASRGSVIGIFQQQASRGQMLTVTDPTMSRFLVTMPQAVEFVVTALARMQGGEIFVPKLEAWDLGTLAGLFAPPSQWQTVDRRPGGEKLHEFLIATEEEARTRWHAPFYVIPPDTHEWREEAPWQTLPHAMLAAYSSWTARRVPLETLKELVFHTPS